MLKMGALACLSVALLGGAVASSGLLVVDVREADGSRLVLPVPLVLARAATHFVPDEHTRIPCPELEEHLAAAKELTKELLEIGDAELVRVEDGNETIVISKVGEHLKVEVQGDGEEVLVSLPLVAVAEILESYDGEGFVAREVISALGDAPRSDLVHVRDGEEEIKIWIC